MSQPPNLAFSPRDQTPPSEPVPLSVLRSRQNGFLKDVEEEVRLGCSSAQVLPLPSSLELLEAFQKSPELVTQEPESVQWRGKSQG